ncbi:MAG: RNA methyltransferase [Myxococcales bacterium]|nr:RNA methyltransferase [Myxococcales bacterium]
MTRVERVSDLSAPGVAPYAGLRDRDLRGRGDVFVAEGEVVLRVLASRSRFRIRSLLLSEKRLAALEDVLASLPDDVIAYVAPQSVMDAIVGFSIHRGVLALAERGPARDARELLAAIPPGPALVVALAGVTNHDNVGGIFRNAAAFGVRAVIVDQETCDPLYRKSVRVSVGGALVVPFARAKDAHEIVEISKASGFEPLALSPRGREELGAVSAPRAVLVLGAEGPGLAEDVLAQTRTVRVDMSGELDSLNVAVTSGIALYLASRTRTP